MHYPSLAEFKSCVCVTLKEGSSNIMSLPLVIAQIFNAQPGCAFPEEVGKQTKIELTTGRPHKHVGVKQASPNMVTVLGHGARLYPTKANFSFGYGLTMSADSGSALINCIPDGGTL